MLNCSASCASAPFTPRPLLSGAVVWAVACLMVGGAAVTTAHAQRPAEGKPAAAAVSSVRAPVASKPLWTELNLSQQLALQPLAPEWNTLSAAQKRKWIALSRNYARMQPEEQTVLHSRMTGWAGLSQQQRAQARLNFAEVKQLPADERKAKWEAYQALSEDERRALAERAPTKPRGATLPPRQIATQKLFAPVPVATGRHTPRIQLAPTPPASEALVPAVAAPAAASPAPATVLAPAPIPPVRVTEQPSSAP